MIFFEWLNKAAVYLLPIAGVVLLVVSIILVIRLIRVTKNVDTVVDKGKVTVDNVNHALTEIQKPIDTAVKISGGVDAVYDFGEKAVKSLSEKLVEIINYCRQLLSGNKDNNIEENKEENNGEEERSTRIS